MSSPPNRSYSGVITYFIYGAKGEYQFTYQLELSLSVLSLALQAKENNLPVKIVLISDQQNSRPDLPVEPLIVSAAELSEWTRHGKFYHGAKIHALSKALETYNVATVLIDSDTVFRDKPSRLFDRISPKNSLMHVVEYPLAGASHFVGFLTELVSRRETDIPITENTLMYNSGIIGLDPSDAHLLKSANALVDKILPIEPGPFLAEQLSTSVVLYQNTKLNDCPDIVEHYWGFRRRFIHARTKAMFPQFTRAIFDDNLRSGQLPSFDYPAKSKLDLLITKLKFGTRKDVYPFIYLAYRCAFSAGNSEPENANAWLATALDALHYDSNVKRSIPQLRRDFSRLKDCAKYNWLYPETRTRAEALWRRLE